ncbi:hypothetical protein D3C71_1630120 [compost metagenome]
MDVVLDGDGHAAQWPFVRLGVIGAGLRQRAVAVHGDEGVQRRVGVDAVQAGLGQRDAGQAPFADQGGGLADGQGGQGIVAGRVRHRLGGRGLLG